MLLMKPVKCQFKVSQFQKNSLLLSEYVAVSSQWYEHFCFGLTVCLLPAMERLQLREGVIVSVVLKAFGGIGSDYK